MKKRISLIFPLFCVLFLVSAVARGDDALTFTKTSYASLMGLNKRTENLAKTLEQRAREVFDFDAFAHLCFIDIESKMTPEELSQIKATFSDVFFQTVFDAKSDILKHVIAKPAYHLKGTKGDLVTVGVSGKSPDGMIKMGFYLKHQTDGHFNLADIDVDGVLLSRNYRGSFNRVFREQGFVGLYQRIENKKSQATQSPTDRFANPLKRWESQ